MDTTSILSFVQSKLQELDQENTDDPNKHGQAIINSIREILAVHQPLESLINYRDVDNSGNKKPLVIFAEMQSKLSTRLFADDGTQRFSSVKRKLDQRLKVFASEINSGTRHDKELFAAQDISAEVMSLGYFIAEQLYTLMSKAIVVFDKTIPATTGFQRIVYHLQLLIKQPPERRVLSQIKSELEAKWMSLLGAKSINVLSPISDQSHTSAPSQDTTAILENWEYAALFFANLIEFLLFFPIRLTTTVISFGFSIVYWVITLFETSHMFDDYLSRIHRTLSPTAHVSNLLERYRQTRDKQDASKFVGTFEPHKSFCAKIFDSKWLSGSRLAKIFCEEILTLPLNPLIFFFEVFDLIGRNQTRLDKAFERIADEIERKHAESCSKERSVDHPIENETPIELQAERSHVIHILEIIKKMIDIKYSFSEEDSFEKMLKATDTYLFFDYTVNAIDQYNRLAIKAATPNLTIDAEDFLNCYYNKYCIKNNSLLARLALLPPLWPIYFVIRVWRWLKKNIAASSPSHRYEINRSNQMDAAFVIQIIAFSARFLRQVMKIITYILRTIFIFLTSCAGLLLLINSEYTHYLFRLACKSINIHNLNFFRSSGFLSFYTRIISALQTNERDLQYQLTCMSWRLQAHHDCQRQPAQHLKDLALLR